MAELGVRQPAMLIGSGIAGRRLDGLRICGNSFRVALCEKCAFPVCNKSPLGALAVPPAVGAGPAVCSPLSLASSLRRRSISCKAASYLRWSSSYALFGRVAHEGSICIGASR